VGEVGDAYKIVVGKPEAKNSLLISLERSSESKITFQLKDKNTRSRTLKLIYQI